MRDRATLERNVARDELEDDNLPGKPRFEVIAVLPCEFSTTLETETIDGRTITNIETFRMKVPLRSDVTPSDRISRLEDRRGQVKRDGILEIQTVIDRHDHLELALTSVE